MFHNPLNLLWLFPISALIVVMYILKLRRKDVVVSSTFLWRQVIRDVQANAPFQKLRKNLLLLLQLIIAGLIIFALSRPFFRHTDIGGRNIVVIVDTSASMKAVDVAPSRLESAKNKARDLVREMRPGDMMMVLSAASRPETLTGFTEASDRSALYRAIDALKPHETSINMRDALNLAADLVASRNQGENGRIELISDGGFEGQDSATTTPGAPNAANAAPQVTLANLNLGKTHVEFHPIGTRSDNVGITAVDFRRNLGREKSVELLVVTHNYASVPKTFTEEIYIKDKLERANEVTLKAGEESVEPYDLTEPEKPTRMKIKLDLQDDLATDNEAAIIVKPRKTLKVLLVGEENLFLENALAVDPGVELSKAAVFPGNKGYDVTVFYNDAPPKLPEGNYLFLHCVSDQAPVKVDGTQDHVAPADWQRDDPILRYVDFGNDRFDNVYKAEALGWGREIAVGESGSLVVAGEKGKMRSEFVALSLKDSYLPMRVAFPIFISNSVRWLGTGGDDSEMGQIRTGEPITLNAPPGAGKLTVTKPDGTKREVGVGERGGAVFDDSDQVGFYSVAGQGFAYAFAANLASASESDLTPRKSLTIAQNPTPTQGRKVTTPYELLPWLVALALLILMLEWYAFHRRIYVNG